MSSVSAASVQTAWLVAFPFNEPRLPDARMNPVEGVMVQTFFPFCSHNDVGPPLGVIVFPKLDVLMKVTLLLVHVEATDALIAGIGLEET